MISAEQKAIFIIGLLWILLKIVSKDERLKILEELLEIFSRECTFTTCESTSTKDDDVEPVLWESCSKNDIRQEDWT